jgi:REP element-mobilizing transposase RayT
VRPVPLQYRETSQVLRAFGRILSWLKSGEIFSRVGWVRRAAGTHHLLSTAHVTLSDMTDYRQWRVAGGTYFFTVVTHERRPFLTQPLARACLREAFRIVRARRPFCVDAIVILPDHLQAIWSLPSGDFDYATRWQLIKRRFAKSYLAAAGGEGSGSASRLAKASEACGNVDISSTLAEMKRT